MLITKEQLLTEISEFINKKIVDGDEYSYNIKYSINGDKSDIVDKYNFNIEIISIKYKEDDE